MEVFREGGIVVRDGRRNIVLDPSRRGSHGIVSHGHLDHMVPGSLMTHETREIMQVRLGTGNADTMGFREPKEYRGFEVELLPSGHVLGSAMVLLDEGRLLYTGDFDPAGGFLSPEAEPVDASILVMETTYGEPDFVFPSKQRVLDDFSTWVSISSGEGAVVVGAYEFGKAQEVMKVGKDLGLRLFSTKKTWEITEVYNRYGADIQVSPVEDEKDVVDLAAGDMLVVPPIMLKPGKSPLVDALRKKGAQVTFVSGWCMKYSYVNTYGLHAQFPLSDHADFKDLLGFVEKVDPDVLYLVHGNKRTREIFARIVREEVGTTVKP